MDTLLEAAQAKNFGTLKKHENFFDEYDFNFRDLRNTANLRILEIGVQGGGSLGMWREYFKDAYIVGMDIDPTCKQWERDGIHIAIGDQGDEETLQIEHDHGPFDIVIDDGGHTMKQQLTTFNVLFPKLRDNGIFVIEDLHTSYWPAFGGRKNKRATTIGFVKSLIDEIHFSAVQSTRAGLINKIRNKMSPMKAIPKNILQESVRSVYVADSIVFIRKQLHKKDRLLKF
jgi:hypothetical protein